MCYNTTTRGYEHMTIFDTNNQSVQLALVLKLSSVQKETLSSLTYDELEKIFNRLIWRRQKPKSLNEAINDIFKLTHDDLVGFLAKLSELESYQKTIDDYKDVYLDHENK